MGFKMRLSDLYRVFSLGIALILTIPELVLLAVFTRDTTSQGSTYPFEIMGLVTSSLTLLLLPVFIFCPRIAPNAPISLLVLEIPVLVILSALWLSFVILEKNQQNKWYPVPKAYRNQVTSVSGCQFVSNSEGQEAYWCKQWSSNWALAIVIMVLILAHTLIIVGISLLFHMNGRRIWTRTFNDVLDHKIPARQPQQPQVSVPRSQPAVYKSQLFDGRWKKGKKAGRILSETASVQDGSDYISLPATDDLLPPLEFGQSGFVFYRSDFQEA